MIFRAKLLVFILLILLFINYAENTTQKSSTTKTPLRKTSTSFKTTSKPTRKVKETREKEFKSWVVGTKDIN